jgi:hypothetical protein
MWQHLSRILERVARVRFPLSRRLSPVQVGDPRGTDVRGGDRWTRYLRAEQLFDLWGPLPGTPWEPFHCVTLFAALDSLPSGRVGPTSREDAARIDPRIFPESGLRADAPGWKSPDCLAVVDLPGPEAVSAGAGFVAAGFQPVCTFDHWPHPAGLLSPERILAELLRQAPRVEDARSRLTPASPPVWICDRDRLGTRPGRPREFDNRYYLDESLVPGFEILFRAGIRRIVCVLPDGSAPLLRDLEAYLSDLHTRGLDIYVAAAADPRLEPSRLRPRRSADPQWSGFHRSSAGGFGVLVPEPSSGGS